MNFQHSKQILENIPEKGFLVYNEFTWKGLRPTLEEIIYGGLLDEDYFNNEDQNKEIQKQLKNFISIGITNRSYLGEDRESELYGPLLKNQIRPSDFLKLDYQSYLNKIVDYINLWTEKGGTDMAEALIEFHQITLEHMKSMSPDRREYYFLDADLINKEKIYEVNWYDYFFTVISTLNDSDKVVIINFGND